ncbi:MAG TPA: FecR family protein, partial [Woeseiaceae bacterium]|nr:FecR family protein [Woeseiaceae bacterium]
MRADAADAPDNLIVEETTGAVKIKLRNQWQSPDVGMAVSLPATVSTGADGSIKLRQDATIISVASSTAIELFEGPGSGATLQRVVQNQGSAFYDIAPRESNKLRVETPYLVAVIKGTQFNVTVAAETSTVALFEGRLQIEAPEVGDVVDLREGQIARRHKDDAGITVLRMEDSEPVSRSDASPDAGSTGGGDGRNGGGPGNGDSIGIDDGSALTDNDVVVHIDHGVGSTGSNGATNPGVEPNADPAPGQGAVGAKPGTDSGIDFAPDDLAVGLDSGIELGDGVLGVGLATDVDLASAVIDVELDSSLGLGDVGLDLGLDTGVDLAAGDLDVGLDTGLDLGDVGVDAGLDLGADLGAGDIDLGLDVGADLGDAVADVGLDLGVDLGAGDIDAGLDVGADLGDIVADVGLDAGADLGTGEIDA